MDFPEYITTDEVKRVCDQIGIRDWTQLTEPAVELREAKIIRDLIGSEALDVSIEAFKQGLEVELEHGVQYPDANVTNNHPLLTGKIVLAHLKEMLDYYLRLDVAELEGDMLKALVSGDEAKLAGKFRKLVEARAKLNAQEQAQLP